MKAQIITKKEAKTLGLIHSRILTNGHGAFGESDNSYEDFVFIDKIKRRISEDDLIIFIGESPNREIIQVISNYDSSDKILELLNPELLTKRRLEKYERFLKLKKEIESDEFYKTKATSLNGCPFMYCDSNPKCENSCRYSKP